MPSSTARAHTFDRKRHWGTAVLLLAWLPFVAACGKSGETKPQRADSPAASGDESKTPAPDSSQPKTSAGTAGATGPAPDSVGATGAAAEPTASATTLDKPAAESTTKADPPPKAAPPAIEDVVREPATVAEAMAVVDLRKLPVPADVENPNLAVSMSSFITKQDAKATYAAIEKFLTDAGCKPYREPQSYDTSHSGGFTRNGFRFSVSVFAAGEQTNAMVFNLGNVNLAKLPVPPGAKPWHTFPDTAAFITDAGVDETREATRKLLVEHGWQPYGGAADTRDFKKNATEISVTINSPPATPGQTVITFGSRQLSADLPAPPEATRVDYSDNPTQVYVDMPGSAADAVAFNLQALTAAGWKATTDKPIEDGRVQMLIFRNDAKDMLTLTVRPGEESTNYSLEFLTGEQVAKLDEAAKKLAAEEAKKRAEEEAQAEAERNKPKPKASIPVPADAKNVEAGDDELEFQVASGKAKAAWDAIVKALEADGWKSRAATDDKVAGHVTFEKDGMTINVSYVDAGQFIPAQVTVSGFRVGIERAAADKE